MFNLFGKRESPVVLYQAYVSFEKTKDRSIESLLSCVLESIQKLDSSAMLLAAYQFVPERYLQYLKASVARRGFYSGTDANVEGYIRYLAFNAGESLDIRFQRVRQDQAVEYRRRELLYLAVLIKEMHKMAQQDPDQWDALAELWVELLKRNIGGLEDMEQMWTQDEVYFFRPIHEGLTSRESFSERYHLPHELLYHRTIRHYVDRDLPSDLIDELRTENMKFSDCLGLLNGKDHNAVLPTLQELEPIELKQ